MSEQCPLEPPLAELTGYLKAHLKHQGRTTSFYQWVIKALLVVLCVIALGKSGIEAFRDGLKLAETRATTSAKAEELK